MPSTARPGAARPVPSSARPAQPRPAAEQPSAYSISSTCVIIYILCLVLRVVYEDGEEQAEPVDFTRTTFSYFIDEAVGATSTSKPAIVAHKLEQYHNDSLTNQGSVACVDMILNLIHIFFPPAIYNNKPTGAPALPRRPSERGSVVCVRVRHQPFI